MKITDIKVHLPLGLLRIQTDAGIEGLSDGCGATCAEFIQQVYRPELLGQDPFYREVIWQRLMHLERLRYPPANVDLEVTSLCPNRGFVDAIFYGAIKNTASRENNADLDRDPVVRDPRQVRDGILCMPAGPGLGFDLDPQIVAQRTERVV